MSFDANGLGLAPGMVLAALGYAAVSVLGTGQVIGERMIAKSGWMETCPAALRAAIDSERPALTPIPSKQKIDCKGAALTLFGPEVMPICGLIEGLPLPPDPAVEAAKARRRMEEAQNRRLTRLAAASGSRCGCAVSTLLEKERIAFGIHAGSARLMTPAPVADLTSSLAATLNSAPCAAQMGGLS